MNQDNKIIEGVLEEFCNSFDVFDRTRLRKVCELTLKLQREEFKKEKEVFRKMYEVNVKLTKEKKELKQELKEQK